MHYFSTTVRNNIVPFVAGMLVVSLVVVTGFTRHIFASPATSASALPASVTNVDAFSGMEWSLPSNALINDGSLSTTSELEDGYYHLLGDTPTIPAGDGYGTDFHPEEHYVVVANPNEDAGLTVIDMTTLTIVADTFQPEGYVNTVKFSEDGSLLAVGIDNDGDNSVDLLTIIDSSSDDASEWVVIEDEVQQPGGNVHVLEFSPDGSHLAVGYSGGVLMAIYDTDTWTILDDGEVEPAHLDFGIPHTVFDFDFSSDGEYLAVAHESGNRFTVIETDTWEVVSGYVGGEDNYVGTDLGGVAGLAISFTPDDAYLLVGMMFTDEEIYVLDASNEDPALWDVDVALSPNEDDASALWSFEFSPDGNELAIAYQDSSYFGIVDTSDEDPAEWVGVDTSESVGELAGGKSGNAGQGIAYSSDGDYIAVAHSGGTGLSLITTRELEVTDYLSATDFGFEIPENATILGVEAMVEKHTDGQIDVIVDNSVRLVVDGTVVGDNLAIDERWSNDSDGTESTYGAEDDTWDVDLTPAIVNSEDFGFAFSASLILGGAGVDVMSLTVYYSLPGEEVEESSRSSSSGGKPRVTGAPTTKAISSDAQQLTIQLRTLINQFVALGGTITPELQAFLGTSESSSMDVRDLELGMEGEDVRMLQTLLIGQGYSIPPGATAYFGTYTRDALAAYQAKYDVSPSVGYFGIKTRTQMKGAGLSGLWW